MTLLEIAIIIAVALLFFALGFYAAAKLAFVLMDLDDEADNGNLYCFECEWEMPVKEKNGRLSCTNCGLLH